MVIRSNTVFRICLELAVSRKGWVRLDVKENKQVVPKIALPCKKWPKKKPPSVSSPNGNLLIS